MSYDNSAIIGTTLTGVTGLMGVGLLTKAAKMLNDDTDPEDLPKKKKNMKREKTWY